MPSTFTSSTGSPISKLPYDILLEIFHHCLPPQPQYSWKEYPQPDPNIAPILLCHICSSWRTVALTAPSLWMCLSYSFKIAIWDDYDVFSTSGTFQFLAREIELVRWWRANQGHVPPSLNFSVDECDACDLKPWEETDDTDGMDFLLEAIFAAQFLDVHELFWCRKQIRAGHRVVFPNLHTLLMKQVTINNEAFYSVLRLLPINALPALRRISIVHSDTRAAVKESVRALQRWSTAVTHLFLHALISPDFWFACLEGFPNLRWGWFEIDCHVPAMPSRERVCTLPQLATLRVHVDDIVEQNKAVCALAVLFGNLHLPALRTLSFSMRRWSLTEDYRVLNDLDSVLRATPGLTTLYLDDSFIALCTERIAAPHGGDGAPIWRHAPQLAHVQLYVAYGKQEMSVQDAVDMCVSCIVGAEGGWLGLRDPACPVQSLAIMEPIEYDQGFRDLIMERVRESTENARVVIQALKRRSKPVYIFVS